jgi:hypothetical protein
MQMVVVPVPGAQEEGKDGEGSKRGAGGGGEVKVNDTYCRSFFRCSAMMTPILKATHVRKARCTAFASTFLHRLTWTHRSGAVHTREKVKAVSSSCRPQQHLRAGQAGRVAWIAYRASHVFAHHSVYLRGGGGATYHLGHGLLAPDHDCADAHSGAQGTGGRQRLPQCVGVGFDGRQ